MTEVEKIEDFLKYLVRIGLLKPGVLEKTAEEKEKMVKELIKGRNPNARRVVL